MDSYFPQTTTMILDKSKFKSTNIGAKENTDGSSVVNALFCENLEDIIESKSNVSKNDID